jgi:broad specificity phosphatase PhoE
MRRLLLVRHSPTTETRRLVFPADEHLDGESVSLAASLGSVFPGGCEAICSPAVRARQTAVAAGLDARVEPRLAECDFGSWAGRSLAELHAEDAEAVERWMSDPDARPHAGETLSELSLRVAGWLDDATAGDGCLVAMTHGGVIRAAVAHALEAPLATFWRIDVEPLSVSELHAHDRRWTVKRLGCPLVAVR